MKKKESTCRCTSAPPLPYCFDPHTVDDGLEFRGNRHMMLPAIRTRRQQQAEFDSHKGKSVSNVGNLMHIVGMNKGELKKLGQGMKGGKEWAQYLKVLDEYARRASPDGFGVSPKSFNRKVFDAMLNAPQHFKKQKDGGPADGDGENDRTWRGGAQVTKKKKEQNPFTNKVGGNGALRKDYTNSNQREIRDAKNDLKWRKNNPNIFSSSIRK